jgi:hypothetical protein
MIVSTDKREPARDAQGDYLFNTDGNFVCWVCLRCELSFLDASPEEVHSHAVKCMSSPDPVNRPQHYTSHPSGIECIQITEHMSFTLGNAIKYIWRADLKNGTEDLEKAIWYLTRELEKRKP